MRRPQPGAKIRPQAGHRHTTCGKEDAHIQSLGFCDRPSLWEYAWGQIANHILPTSSHYYEERKRTIWASVCRAISTDSTLMLLALNYAGVHSFLNDPDHDISTVRKLQQQMKSVPMTKIWAAIDDVLRPIGEGAEYVTVLGIRLYKVDRGKRMRMCGKGRTNRDLTQQNCVNK
ncbi:hypothetical protein K438DRAFT_1984745 [Mycena galopus ATCC 62051]|nr:hypothetical protein K438DRAFT_1984745 [Mycena galopus ATCC 62051]